MSKPKKSVYTFDTLSLSLSLPTTLPPPQPGCRQPKKSHSHWTLLNNTTIVVGMNV